MWLCMYYDAENTAWLGTLTIGAAAWSYRNLADSSGAARWATQVKLGLGFPETIALGANFAANIFRAHLIGGSWRAWYGYSIHLKSELQTRSCSLHTVRNNKFLPTCFTVFHLPDYLALDKEDIICNELSLPWRDILDLHSFHTLAFFVYRNQSHSLRSLNPLPFGNFISLAARLLLSYSYWKLMCIF